MGVTRVTGKNIKDASVQRSDLDISTTGEAVIRKAVAGTGVSLSSTGADAGTGDVTISISSSLSGNYISNSGAETDTSGWSASGANFTIARTTTAGEVLKGSGSFELTANGSQTVDDYVSTSFTLDLGDRNRLLKVGFYFKGTSNYDSGDMGIVFHDGTNEIVPSITAVPGGDGYFEASWVSTSASSYTIRFKAKVTTAFSIAVDDIFAGPLSVVRGAAIGTWEAFTPTFAGLGTVTGISMYKRRVGENLEIKGVFTTGTPTGVAPTMTIGGNNINTTGLTSLKNYFGYLNRLTASSASPGTDANLLVAAYNASATAVQFCGRIVSGLFVDDTGPTLFGSSEQISIPSLMIPIDGWTSEVVLASEQVEYAYNGTTNDADDTTSFAYGEAGGLVPNSSVDRNKRVRFTKVYKHVRFEVSDRGGPWQPVENSRFSLIRRGDAGTGITGMGIKPVTGSQTDWDVHFNGNVLQATSTISEYSFATEYSNNTKYRVVGSDNPSAVETSDKVVQVVYEEITTSGTFATAQIPFDDTIPQNTEGAELLTATIVPRYANSYLIVEAVAFVGENTNTSGGIAAAVFRDSTANAVAVDFCISDVTNNIIAASHSFAPLRPSVRVTSNAATSTTFKLRIGLDTSSTVRYNGVAGSRMFGGSLVSYLKITEVRA